MICLVVTYHKSLMSHKLCDILNRESLKLSLTFLFLRFQTSKVLDLRVMASLSDRRLSVLFCTCVFEGFILHAL